MLQPFFIPAPKHRPYPIASNHVFRSFFHTLPQNLFSFSNSASARQALSKEGFRERKRNRIDNLRGAGRDRLGLRGERNELDIEGAA
ncbi:hypothetical protein [Rhizobium jaguaris]|uniref:hypothetical protein n=1 Tax=Rhizobium jaguaris TaxID=1312183 RepID=UPI003CCB0626